MKYVLDACALIAFLRKESGGELVRDIILSPKHSIHIHALNLCEVYYDFARGQGESVADEMIQVVSEIGIIIDNDLDRDLWVSAGRLKARIKRISLADTLAVEHTNAFNATLLTSDHKEFDRLDNEKYCKIQFIR